MLPRSLSAASQRVSSKPTTAWLLAPPFLPLLERGASAEGGGSLAGAWERAALVGAALVVEPEGLPSSFSSLAMCSGFGSALPFSHWETWAWVTPSLDASTAWLMDCALREEESHAEKDMEDPRVSWAG
jgi:hypothetical protein